MLRETAENMNFFVLAQVLVCMFYARADFLYFVARSVIRSIVSFAVCITNLVDKAYLRKQDQKCTTGRRRGKLRCSGENKNGSSPAVLVHDPQEVDNFALDHSVLCYLHDIQEFSPDGRL